MPDISALNGTAINNVAEFDGLTVTEAPAFTGLLDTYTGAAVGYSTRKLKTGVTVATRIRRSGDNIEADVEFDSNNEISLTSPISNASSGTYTDLADFVNHSTTPRDAFVKEWKDQSGNGLDATQSDTTAQPKIYDATTGLIIENGKPALDFDGSNNFFDVPSTQWTDGEMMASIVLTGTTFDDTYWVDSNNTAFRMFNASSEHKFIAWPLTPIVISKGSNMALGQLLVTGRIGTTSEGYTLYENGSSVANAASYTGSMPTTSQAAYIGQNNNSTQRYGGNMQELIHWPSNQTSDRTGIEENINSEYLIYQPTTQPTSGLLYDYGSATGGTDAAAAYSVRQLSDKAVICMRIRRDMGAGNPGDDDETNIGFDANGDLDTQAISAFCGTGTGWVTRWWDQSVNGNHADQPVGGTGSSAFQPQIYNGTAVITENGKPALQYLASDSSNMISSANIGISGTGDRTQFIVAECDNLSGNTESIVLSYGSDPLAGTAWQITFEPWIRVGSGYQSFSGTTANTQHLLTTALWSGTNVTDSSMFIDGSAATAGTAASRALNTTNSTLKIGAGSSGAPLFSGKTQEIIVYASDESSNRTGIETNIDTYYQIPGM